LPFCRRRFLSNRQAAPVWRRLCTTISSLQTKRGWFGDEQVERLKARDLRLS